MLSIQKGGRTEKKNFLTERINIKFSKAFDKSPQLETWLQWLDWLDVLG